MQLRVKEQAQVVKERDVRAGASCRDPELLHLVITLRVERSFIERPTMSNSMEH
jgi:hypothetical protein